MRCALLLSLPLLLAAGPMPPHVPPPAPRPAVPDAAAVPGCDPSQRPGMSPGRGVDRPLPFGCATALNFEAMLANPGDLEAPAGLPAAMGDAVVRPVEAWRRGETPLPPAADPLAPSAAPQ
jgi:hypothetical protein